MKYLSLGILLLFAVVKCEEETPIVKVKNGQIQGNTMTTFNGRKLYSFRGIPYAKPPTGERRFKLPEPADSWDDVLDATEDGPICPQNHMLTRQYVGEEDCLIINVYTPKLPSTSKSPKLPVMAWIHGGGFAFGDSTTAFYGPKLFLDKDIVLVTFNYRLGVLGFLSTEDDAAPGNMGLWDQNLALKWIQENIRVFGGDPDSVTLFGESAGAASTQYHVLSSASKGLFHRAILQSGSALCPWAFQEDPLPVAKKVAETLDCPTESTQALIECLRKKNPKDFLKKCKFADNLMKLHFLPVVEKNTNGPKFLENDPETILRKGLFNKYPIISGITKDEGIEFYLEIYKDFQKFDTTFANNHLDTLLTQTSYLTQEATPHLKKIFLSEIDFEDVHEQKLKKALIDAFSAMLFNSCNKDTVEYLRKHVPTYMYILEHKGKVNLPALYGITEDLGVSHIDDLFLLFNGELVTSQLEGKDKEVSEKMIEFWTNFAKYGNPNGNDSKKSWEPVTSEQIKYFRFGFPMQSESYQTPAIFKKWKNLQKKFKIQPQPHDEL